MEKEEMVKKKPGKAGDAVLFCVSGIKQEKRMLRVKHSD